jgi:hypothetical protein
MFGRRYFAGRYFAPRYFPDGGGSVVDTPADLYEALADLLSADSTLTSLFGRDDWFWYGVGPTADTLPYAVLSDVDGKTQGEAGTIAGQLDDGSFQIATYATSRALSRSLGRAVAAAIETASQADTITFDEGTLLYLRRSGGGFDQLDPDPAPGGGDVWGHVIQFKAIVEAAT